ncbi:MAG: amidohydrolase [Anaerolineae bacterium]|nr:amidohydrolase [Anaerolineae bacterium]
MIENFYEQAKALKPEIVKLRRDLHRFPELAFEETRTAGIVVQTLSSLGLKVESEVGRTGVVGLLEGDQPGPTVLVRADMDALPIDEENQVDYASTRPGKMHACGHDGHTSIALTVARLLNEHRESLQGRVKFIFQPAEETGKGAEAMINDGVLRDPRPDVSLGLHVWNDIPVGKVGVTPGPCMAAADDWRCVITGRGGHGAAPHQTRDPIVAAAQIITALQSIVSRNISPLETGVITVGRVNGGDAFNVIPPTVELKGTIRAFDQDIHSLLRRRLKEICEGVAASLQCQAELSIDQMTLAVDNDTALSARVAGFAAELLGAENVISDVRTMGSEDMSYFMDEIPGCFFFIGSANPDHDLIYPHHNPYFDFDEDALVIGAALLSQTIASFVLPE